MSSQDSYMSLWEKYEVKNPKETLYQWQINQWYKEDPFDIFYITSLYSGQEWVLKKNKWPLVTLAT